MTPFEATRWPLKQLGSLCQPTETVDPRRTPTRSFKYIDIASVSNQTFQITTPKELIGSAAPSRARKRIRRGDVIFATTRPYLRSVALVTSEYDDQVCSTGFCVLRVTDSVLPEWLFHCVVSEDCLAQITPKMRGANYPAVTDKDVHEACIPVPPIHEQRRIVARIQEMLSRVDEIKRLREEAKREVQAIFPSLLKSRMTDLAMSLGTMKLEKLATIRGGQSLPEGSTLDPGKDYPMLFKVGDMTLEGNDRVAKTCRAYAKTNALNASAFPSGTVILPKRGGAIATNKKRVLGRPALLDPNLMGIVPNLTLIKPAFLHLWFESFDLQKLVSGSTVPQLNKQDLAPLGVPTPPLPVQERTCEELLEAWAATQSLLENHESNAREESALAQATLRKAFAGEL